jgi:hypothetical protein
MPPPRIHDDLFLEPMMGTPLAIFIEKDVPDRDQLVHLVSVSSASFFRFFPPHSSQAHGGVVSPGYSGVPYILGNICYFLCLVC